MLRITLMALCLVLAAGVTPAQEPAALPDDVVALRQMANQAHAREDDEALRSILVKLSRLRPNNSEYMYQLVLAHAQLGELNQAFDLMLRMQRQGLSYDFDRASESINLRDTQLYGYLNDLMVKAGKPVGETEVVFTLPAELGMVEAIDWDPGREAFIVGTVSDGRLLEVGRDGSTRELLSANAENGLWGIHGVLVDHMRGRLWVSTAATETFSRVDPIDAGRSALIALDLETLEEVGRYPVPVDGLPHILGQMALAEDGTLYLADRALPIVYMLAPGQDRLHPLFATRNLVSLRGIDVSSERGLVYVADYEMGVVVIDTRSGEVGLLVHEETLNLGGLEELIYHDDALIVVQNGIRPQRIMRLALDRSGRQVVEVAPVAVAQPWFDDPSFGALVGDELFYFANSLGVGPGRDRAPEPLSVARVGVEGVSNLVPPDMERFLERQAQQRMQRPEPAPAQEQETETDQAPPDEG